MKLKVMYRVLDEKGETIFNGTAKVVDARPIKDKGYIRKIEKKLEKELGKGKVEIFNWKVIGTIDEKLQNR